MRTRRLGRRPCPSMHAGMSDLVALSSRDCPRVNAGFVQRQIPTNTIRPSSAAGFVDRRSLSPTCATTRGVGHSRNGHSNDPRNCFGGTGRNPCSLALECVAAVLSRKQEKECRFSEANRILLQLLLLTIRKAVPREFRVVYEAARPRPVIQLTPKGLAQVPLAVAVLGGQVAVFNFSTMALLRANTSSQLESEARSFQRRVRVEFPWHDNPRSKPHERCVLCLVGSASSFAS